MSDQPSHSASTKLARLRADLEACERLVWDALLAGDQAADVAALDDGFLGVYPSGFADKSDHIEQLAAGPSISSYEMSDLRVRDLGRDHALLSYRAGFVRAGQSQPEVMYVSSIWQRDGAGWINIFSQDTPTEARDDR